MQRVFLMVCTLLFWANLAVNAQANQAEFQLSAISTEHYSVKSAAKPLNNFGVNYQPYLFPRTYLVLGLQGNARNYQEVSKDTLNPYTGNLKTSQFMASIGVRHLFRQEVIETVNYFAEANFHYMRLKTEGVYADGQFGSAFYRYNRFKGVGLDFKAGAVYQFNSPWYVGANLALYFTGGKSGELSNYTILPEPEPVVEELLDNKGFNTAGFELRIGYRFFKK